MERIRKNLKKPIPFEAARRSKVTYFEKVLDRDYQYENNVVRSLAIHRL